MYNRLKLIRKNADMTQSEFASRVGATRGMIAKYETGLVVPDEAIIELVCLKFNVSRTWLETGEGEPYKQSVLIPELVRVLSNAPALKAALERIVPLMTDDDWATLDRLLDRIAEDAKKEP